MFKEIRVKIDETDLTKLKDWFQTPNEQDAVKSAISHVLKLSAYDQLLELEGKIIWESDLNQLRDEE